MAVDRRRIAHRRPPRLRKLWGALGLGVALTLTVASSLLTLGGCSDTREVPLDVCGNGVLDPGEDCDGSVDCTASCRYPCDAERACPPGFGCDVAARVCRAPRGSFSRQTSISATTNAPCVGDFDADGRDDLLLVNGGSVAFSPSSVYYFDADGQVGTRVDLPSASAAVSAELSGDTRADVLLGGDDVLGFRATASRKFSPILSASRSVASTSRLFSADLTCDRQRDILLLEGRTLSRATSASEVVPLLELVSADEELTDASAVGRMPSASGDACEMLAVLSATDGRVHVYGPTDGVAQSEVVRLSSVALPEGGGGERLLFADVNADGRQDLITQLSAGSSWVAFGVADGTFHSTPNGIPDAVGDGRFGAVALGGEFADIVLVTQLDDDPELDFFYGSPADGSFSYNYDAAFALDLTGDGRNDVAALSANEDRRRIDLYRSHADGSSSRLSLFAPGPSSLRDAADLDGDGQQDLLVSSGLEPEQIERSLSVLFTPLSPGVTPQLQELAELPDIRAVVAGYVADAAGVVDGNADIGILYGGEGARVLGLLQAGADRLLRSPLGAESPALGQSFGGTSTPLLGRFRQSDKQDVVVVRSAGRGDVTTTLVLLSIEESSVVSLASATFMLPNDPGSFVVLDLDGDGLDELYCVFSSEEHSTEELATVPQVAQIKLEYRGSPETLELTVEPDFWGSSVLGIIAADVNADGRPDLSVQVPTGVVVQLANGGRVEVSLPFLDCLTPVAQAWVQADTDQPRELVVNCVQLFGEELELADSVTPSLRVYDVDLESGAHRLLSEQVGPGSSTLVTGDFDGDGVEDLAAGNSQAVVLFGDAR